MDDWKVIALSDLKQNAVFQALKKIENPEDIGNILIYHIANNVKEEDRVAAIKTIMKRLTSNIVSCKLPEGELERIRDIAKQI